MNENFQLSSHSPYKWYLCIFLLLLLVGCTPELANDAEITPVTAVPTETDATLCAIGQDHALDLDIRLDALVRVHERFGNCDTDIDLLLSGIYQELGNSLIAGGDSDSGEDALRLALFYNPDSVQLQEQIAVIEMVSGDAGQDTVCEQETELGDYQATEGEFATLTDNGFEISMVFLI